MITFVATLLVPIRVTIVSVPTSDPFNFQFSRVFKLHFKFSNVELHHNMFVLARLRHFL